MPDTTDTDLDALKPCPWCGGKPSVCEDDSYGACSIICGSCDTGPDGAHRKKEELAEAIKVWNTRARLAPTTHVDDEALVEMHDHAIRYNGGAPRIWEAACALRRRLAELRARAEKAERALAECRAKTIEECAKHLEYGADALGRGAAAKIRALKTKEPRDA